MTYSYRAGPYIILQNASDNLDTFIRNILIENELLFFHLKQITNIPGCANQDDEQLICHIHCDSILRLKIGEW